jgi:tetratricopeptide (TPR) repeat protein
MSREFPLVQTSVPLELTEDRWRRIQALFHSAGELPEALRAPFLDRETAGDPDLRRVVEEMLAQVNGAPARLARTVSAVAREAAGGVWLGRRVGSYRLVRELGRGGMGVVYEACRDDDEYRKTVALKLAPECRDWSVLGERLRHERQILAGLEHPNIARLLDGGSQNGVPYFAMEFVEGSPITAYCRERRLGIRARLELFLQVCAATHYAHERLVVHRDLKPANILVNREGVPKLLDFGIAKLLSLSPLDAGATGGLAQWTPDYTSPEQVRGGVITTRTDVYLLGLCLYELLCGERAQNADVSSPMALDRSVCEANPPPPSARAAARGNPALARRLRGDLDNIVGMAIRKEPERRYSSAAALGEDLRRYLDGRPVEARRGSFAYRAWKLARRHRTAVAAAMLVVLTTAGGVIATVYQARRAERRFQDVRKLANSVLFELDDRIANLPGATEAREWAARQAVEYLDSLAKDAGGDRGLLLELAQAFVKVGDVQALGTGASLGHYDDALASHRKALAIAEKLAATDRDPKVLRLLARANQRVASQANRFHQTGTTLEAYRRSASIAESLYAANPGNPEDAELLSSLLLSLAQSELRLGEVTAGTRFGSRAFAVSLGWNAAHPSDKARARLENTRRVVVRGYLYTGDLDTALRVAREHIQGCEDLAAGQPGCSTARRDLMNSYVEMAYVYWHPAFLSLEDRDAAVPWHRKALAIARKMAADDRNNVTAQFDLAITDADICDALNPRNPADAIGYCEEAMSVAKRWPDLFVPDGLLTYLSESLEGAGRRPEAFDALQRSIEISGSMLKDDPSHFTRRQQLLRTVNQMGRLQLSMGDSAGALDRLRQALQMAESMAAAHPDNLICRRDLADTYEGLGRYYQSVNRSQARAWYQKSLDIWTAWPAFAPSTVMDRSRRERLAEAMR